MPGPEFLGWFLVPSIPRRASGIDVSFCGARGGMVDAIVPFYTDAELSDGSVE
jgi:hypothetical protein